MEQNSKCQVENGVPQQANTSTSHLSLMGNHAMSTLLGKKNSSLTSAANNNSSRLEQLGQTGGFSQPDVIQGMFTVTIADTIEKSYLSADAWDRLNLLQQVLQATYGNLYDQQWNIILDLSRTTIGTPACTRYIEGPADEDNDNITVTFSRWFLERCSFGELLGMVNHELGVHLFADIALASAFSFSTRQIAARVYANDNNAAAFFINDSLVGKNRQLPRLEMNSKLLTKAYQTQSSVDGFPGVTPSLDTFACSCFIDEGNHKYNEPFSVKFNTSALKLKSPSTIKNNGGQDDHAYMSHIHVIPNTVIFSPRAAVYAQMALRALNQYIIIRKNRNTYAATDDAETQNEAVQILGYYFLDIARTWEEGIRGHTIKYLLAMVSEQLDDNVVQMAQEYYHWMIDDQGRPNSELMSENDLSDETKELLKKINAPMNTYLSRLNTKLKSLIWRAALSAGIGIGRLTRDLVTAPFRAIGKVAAATFHAGRNLLARL